MSCFSCGKISAIGEFGDFSINFSYGSRLDGVEATGIICDECVYQKYDRIELVSNNPNDSDIFSIEKISKESDFHGHRIAIGTSGSTYKKRGIRLYESISSSERSDIEASLLNKWPTTDPDLLIKLLRALSESEAGRAKAEAARHEAEMASYDRMRAQAERLSAEDLSRIRARQGLSYLKNEDVGKLLESAEWHDRECWRMSEKIFHLKEKILKYEKQLKAAGIISNDYSELEGD